MGTCGKSYGIRSCKSETEPEDEEPHSHAYVHQHILLCNARLLFLRYSAGRNSGGLGRTEHDWNPC
jgi:hypothetical protein